MDIPINVWFGNTIVNTICRLQCRWCWTYCTVGCLCCAVDHKVDPSCKLSPCTVLTATGYILEHAYSNYHVIIPLKPSIIHVGQKGTIIHTGQKRISPHISAMRIVHYNSTPLVRIWIYIYHIPFKGFTLWKRMLISYYLGTRPMAHVTKLQSTYTQMDMWLMFLLENSSGKVSILFPWSAILHTEKIATTHRITCLHTCPWGVHDLHYFMYQ